MTRAPTSRVLTVALFSFALLAIAAVGARSLEAPKDRPILTISGKIQNTNSDGTAQFDRAMLEALGLVTIETSTPWYSGPVKFEGVLLEKLMHAAFDEVPERGPRRHNKSPPRGREGWRSRRLPRFSATSHVPVVTTVPRGAGW